MSSEPSRLAPVLARQTLSTPDRLDQLFVVVGPRGWIALLGLFVLVGTAVAWACLARVPETVQGAGILVGPLGVRPVQAPYQGQVIKVLVQAGQQVAEGQALAELNLPDLQLQQTQAQTRLKQLQEDDGRQRGLEKLREGQEKDLRQSQAKVLDRAIQEGEEMVRRLEEQPERLLKNQREQTAKTRREAATLRDSLTEKVASSRRLAEQRLLSAERLLEVESRLLDSSVNLANLDQRLGDIDLKVVDNAQAIAQQRGRVTDLRVQRLQLDTRLTQAQQEIARARAQRLVLQQEQKDRLYQLDGLLKKYELVRSPQAGMLTELLLQPGQVLQAGSRVGTLALTSADTTLIHRAYFPVAAGKRIRPGLKVRLTPTTVRRERYGSMLGTVRKVSPFPITREAATTMLGNSELVSGLLSAQGVIEVEVDLQPADTPSGYRWTSAGPPERLTVGTTTVTRVIVEERAPITYLLPLLRSLWEGKTEAPLPKSEPAQKAE